MTAWSSSRDGLETRISSPWIVACAFLNPPSLIALMILLAMSCGMPWVSLTVRRTDWPVAAIELPHVEVLHRHAALDHPGLQHVHQRVHPELVVGRQADLGLGTIELDGAVGALEVVALGDLLQRLVDRVVDLLEVGAGGDVERRIAGHGVVARGWKTGRCRRMREGLPGAPRLTTLSAVASLTVTAVDLRPLAPAGAPDGPGHEPTS